VRAASRQYLSIAGPMYAFIGLARSMYFSSQGAGKGFWGRWAQSARLLLSPSRLVAVAARRHARELLALGRGVDGGDRSAVARGHV